MRLELPLQAGSRSLQTTGRNISLLTHGRTHPFRCHHVFCSSRRKNQMRKVLPILTLILFAVALALPLSQPQTVEGQSATEALTTDMDAKTDDLFNGFGVKGTPIDECVSEPEPPTARGNGRFEDNKFIFSERETIEDGLGPTYNDVGCVECHQSVDTGAFGQQMEFRAGHITNGAFVDAAGGQLIHARG